MDWVYLENIYRTVGQKLLQYSFSALGGLLIAFESTIDLFVPCMIAILLDIYTAVMLSKRVRKKYPDRSEGKFRSSYWPRVFKTMVLILALLILASYVDTHVLDGGHKAKSFSFGFFLAYQLISMAENWSSENDSKPARVLQKILVNKAERHFDVDISEIFEIKENNEKKETDENK